MGPTAANRTKRYGYERSHRVLEIVSILFFSSELGYVGVRVAATVDEPLTAVALLVCALVGYLMADLLSGVVHWAGDTLGDERTPFMGKHFVTPFRKHHVDPDEILRHDFVETNGNTCILATPVLAAIAVLLPRSPGFLFFALLTAAFACLFVVLTNQLHKWAHAARPPRPVRWLQQARLVLGPDHHNVHHTAPHHRHYCITVGWMNGLLDGVSFFRRCEALVRLVSPGLVHAAAKGPQDRAA